MKSFTRSIVTLIIVSFIGLSTLATASHFAHKSTESTINSDPHAHTVNAIYQHMLLHPMQ